ncbi:LysR family transcriptional regulator [Aliivibrio sifiae]|uniref:LysR family transcriptional regulator n=1 Tax=Aliivibrio sifiae TaxID=566293 RepID=UPI00076A1412
MDLSDFDLNLLKTLLILLQEKNTNKAAERLNTSQPAVSRTLAKLRNKLDDPLFIRQSRGLKLTPKAEELAIHLPKVFSELEMVLQGKSFEPARLSGTMKIAMNGFIIETHGYQICQALTKDAPNIDIELHSFSQKTAIELVNGELDLAISYYPLDISKELRQVPIGRFTFGCICRIDHPLANQKLDMQEIFTYPLAGLIVPEFNSKTMLATKFSEDEILKKPMLRCQHVNPILKAIESSDMLFIAPQSLMGSLDQTKYALIKVEDHLKRHEMKIALTYNSKYMNSAKFNWIEKITDNILPPKMTRH